MEHLQDASTKDLVRELYKNDWGKPFELTGGQIDIFNSIFYKQGPNGSRRIHVETLTQYGKSDVISMAALTRVSTFAEKWAIVAPSVPKAKIIMGYIIKHLFENEYTLGKFKLKEGESMEVIRRERSKNRLTFDLGNNQVGEIFVLSAESRLRESEEMGNALMGFGAPNLIEDEAALISDKSDAKAMRMVGGFSEQEIDFVVKVGNPFTRGHFLKSFDDARYYKIVVDYYRAIREKRVSKKFIDEMRPKPFFSVLYECKFPQADDIDAKGWMQLISRDKIEEAMVKEGEEVEHIGEKRIGHDVARGGINQTVWSMRSMNYMEILAKSDQTNLTDIAATTLFFMNEKKVIPENVFIDEIGVGGGAVDPLRYENKNVRGVNVAMDALEKSRYMNIRAEAYWRFMEWINKGGRLSRDDGWYQLCKIKFKADSKGRVRIMSKDEMRMRGEDSPDVADSGMMTFVRKEHGDTEKRRAQKKRKREGRTYSRGLKVSMGGY